MEPRRAACRSPAALPFPSSALYAHWRSELQSREQKSQHPTTANSHFVTAVPTWLREEGKRAGLGPGKVASKGQRSGLRRILRERRFGKRTENALAAHLHQSSGLLLLLQSSEHVPHPHLCCSVISQMVCLCYIYDNVLHHGQGTLKAAITIMWCFAQY